MSNDSQYIHLLDDYINLLDKYKEIMEYSLQLYNNWFQCKTELILLKESNDSLTKTTPLPNLQKKH